MESPNRRQQLTAALTRNKPAVARSMDQRSHGVYTQRPQSNRIFFRKDKSKTKGKATSNSFYSNLAAYDDAFHGPGAYNTPSLIGAKKYSASYVNAPCYTIAHKTNSKKIFISKGHCRKAVGEDAPGVGLYTPNTDTFYRTSPKFTITRARRFGRTFEDSNRSFETLDLSTPSEKFIKGGVFPKASRFDYSVLAKYGPTPGPSDYTNSFTSRNVPMSVSFTRAKRNSRYENEGAPGPAAYAPKLYTKKSPISLPKAGRRQIRIVGLTPGPSDYSAPDVSKYKSVKGVQKSFTRSKRDFNYKSWENAIQFFSKHTK